MATIISNHENLPFFSKLSLTRMMQLDDEKGEGFTCNTFKHFIIQLGGISHTWPPNPHGCG